MNLKKEHIYWISAGGFFSFIIVVLFIWAPWPVGASSHEVLETSSGVTEEAFKTSFHNFTPSPVFSYTGSIIPNIKSKAFLLADVTSAQMILENKSTERLAIGSLTKLMTAVVAVENFSLDEKVKVPHEAVLLPGSKLGIRTGEEFVLRDILTATLVKSGNDGAYTLAAHAKTGSGTFIQWMNEKAQVLGMHDTHFSNPMGFDDPENYSSAKDLFLLSSFIVDKYPELVDMVDKKEFELISTIGKHYFAKSTNALLGSFLPMKGLKTGTTEEAGASFIGYAKDPESKKALVAIVLASPDRFQEVKTLLWWGFKNGDVR